MTISGSHRISTIQVFDGSSERFRDAIPNSRIKKSGLPPVRVDACLARRVEQLEPVHLSADLGLSDMTDEKADDFTGLDVNQCRPGRPAEARDIQKHESLPVEIVCPQRTLQHLLGNFAFEELDAESTGCGKVVEIVAFIDIGI